MAFQYKPCDSYFVEGHDAQFDFRDQQSREKTQAMEKHIRKQRQLRLAENLSIIARDDYQDDHLLHMERMEVETLPDVASIDIQTEIEWYMRPYLLDFLIEAHAAFGLLPESLFLTVNILDRYCSRRVVYRKHYQLVGVTALLVAAKYGDCKDRVPTIKELKRMCCELYEENTFIEMEWHVLQTLDWVIGHPTVDSFFKIMREGSMYDAEAEHMALYIGEIAMFHKEFVSKRSSDIARSSMSLARHILHRRQPEYGCWESCFDQRTMVALARQIRSPSLVVYQKYTSPQLSRVSQILNDFILREANTVRNVELCTPPTPPSASHKRNASSNPYETPSKRVNHGSHLTLPIVTMTPPETPDTDHFSQSTTSTSLSAFPRPPQCTSPSPQNYHQSTYMDTHYYQQSQILI
ncbi:hypothetical protein MMC25_007240 [Agyrium rufum]|nr:hypothetical protein [Agyrium rufum]